MKVAYCTGFWCTNIGNGFFSMGVEHVLKKILGAENVTVVSDLQTYTTSYGKRLYVDKNQLRTRCGLYRIGGSSPFKVFSLPVAENTLKAKAAWHWIYYC